MQGVGVEEVTEGGVGELPAVLAVGGVVLEPDRGELAPDQRGIVGVVGGVAAHVGEHVLGQRAGGADAEHGGGLALAGGQGDDFVGLAGDHADLVEDRQGRVEALETAGLGGQASEGGAALGDHEPVLEDLHSGGELGLELDHPGGRGEHDPGLPLVGGADHDLGALLTEHQVVEAERGDEGRLALTARQHPAGQPRAGRRVQDRGAELDLPGPEPEPAAGTLALGDGDVGLGEVGEPGGSGLPGTQQQRGSRRRRPWVRPSRYGPAMAFRITLRTHETLDLDEPYTYTIDHGVLTVVGDGSKASYSAAGWLVVEEGFDDHGVLDSIG